MVEKWCVGYNIMCMVERKIDGEKVVFIANEG
jgi:hypothetical protein